MSIIKSLLGSNKAADTPEPAKIAYIGPYTADYLLEFAQQYGEVMLYSNSSGEWNAMVEAKKGPTSVKIRATSSATVMGALQSLYTNIKQVIGE